MPLLRNYGWQSIKLNGSCGDGDKNGILYNRDVVNDYFVKVRPRMLMTAENLMVFVVRLIVIVISHSTILKLKGY